MQPGLQNVGMRKNGFGLCVKGIAATIKQGGKAAWNGKAGCWGTTTTARPLHACCASCKTQHSTTDHYTSRQTQLVVLQG
jgi:hypothetical protein